MISRAFKVSSIAAAALLAACGGGDSVSPAPTPTPPVNVAPSTEAALDAVKGFLARRDAQVATAIPVTGAAAFSLSDGCSLADGRSKAYTVAEFDAEPQAVARSQADLGSTRTVPVVVADRPVVPNADGTTRREIDIKYVVNYKDGTKNEVAEQTIISGSSSGAKLADGGTCATPDSKTEWRFYGNRKVVETFVTANNERIERTALATGLPLSPAVVYSKYISLGLSDPAKVATYAIITGPGLGFGPTGVANGTSGSLKLLSVRLLRDAPELEGKRNNFRDWLDTDSFRLCSNAAANDSAPADTVNCSGNGGTANTWGSYNNPSGANLDARFASLNITEGSVYTFNVYGDDGWKTVNGQVGRTPIATYTTTLDNLPLSAAVLAGMGPAADLYARVTSTKTPAEIATAIRTKAAISTSQTWTAPGAMPDGRAVALRRNWVFESGRANTTNAAWPASRKLDFGYPGSLATSTTVNIPAPVAALVVPTYAETTLQYVNRNGNNVTSIYSYQ